MQRETKRFRPSRNVCSSACNRAPVRITPAVIGAGSIEDDWHAIRQTRAAPIPRTREVFLILKSKTENRTNLKIGLVGRVCCLGQRGDCYEPVCLPIRNVRTDEKISDVLTVMPIGKNE